MIERKPRVYILELLAVLLAIQNFDPFPFPMLETYKYCIIFQLEDSAPKEHCSGKVHCLMIITTKSSKPDRH